MQEHNHRIGHLNGAFEVVAGAEESCLGMRCGEKSSECDE